MISPDMLEAGGTPPDAIQDQERAKRAWRKVANTPPLTLSDSPAVQDVLSSSDRAVRWVGRLAEKPETPVGKIAETLISNNGALPKETLVEKTGIPSQDVEHTLITFTGIFVEQEGVIIADPLNPKLAQEGEIYTIHPATSKLATAS